MGKKFTTAIVILLSISAPLPGQIGRNPAEFGNPVEVRNPVGSGRVPFFGTGGGLVRTPNPIDRSMNLVVTGNVAGGRHFRGVVPYQATSDFAAPLGSSSLDSFLRRSAGVGNFERLYTGRRIPYFSPTKTVTTTMPGNVAVVRPPVATGSAPYPTGGLRQAADARSKSLVGLDITTSYSRYRPMSMTPEELELRVARSLGRYPLGGEETALPEAEAIAKYNREIQKIKEQALELKARVMGREAVSELRTKIESTESTEQLLRIEKIRQLKGKSGEEWEIDVYEQMKQQIKGLREVVENLAAVEETEHTTEGQSTDEKSVREKIAEISMSVAKAKAIRGPHKSFAAFSKDKFNEYMRIAEERMKQGKYYQAADAYTLALMFKPKDALAYAGKSHALFVTGEYMSSALFLFRAIGIFPEYVVFKIDLVAMVGDKDQLESRIADVLFWLEKSDAPELHFLLAYVYYHMGRLPEAKSAIDAASEKMPDMHAVAALKEAIYAAVKQK